MLDSEGRFNIRLKSTFSFSLFLSSILFLLLLFFLDELIVNGETGTFDMVYIDADKWNYPLYYDKCMELVRKGGIILLDDVRMTHLYVVYKFRQAHNLNLEP